MQQRVFIARSGFVRVFIGNELFTSVADRWKPARLMGFVSY